MSTETLMTAGREGPGGRSSVSLAPFFPPSDFLELYPVLGRTSLHTCFVPYCDKA